jgi:hypothetical protein
MDGQTPKLAILDEANPKEPAVDPKWIKLVEKLAKHPKNRNLILLPEEVELLVSKFRALTEQLINTMGFINKYAPLMSQLAEVENSVRASQAADATDRPSGDQKDDAADRGERTASIPDASSEEPE